MLQLFLKESCYFRNRLKVNTINNPGLYKFTTIYLPPSMNLIFYLFIQWQDMCYLSGITNSKLTLYAIV